MATYNKRGHKAPTEKIKNANNEFEEVLNVNEKDSATASTVNALDEYANKTENWFEKNQKIVTAVIGGVLILTVAYLFYDRYIVEPKEEDAAKESITAQENFAKALDAQDKKTKDSLFNLSLNGSEGKFGFLKIADKYSGTDAANLANYSAGMAYLNLGENQKAIKHLENFSANDEILLPLSKGAIGDAFAQLNQNDRALEYYEKAAKAADNGTSTPRFLYKAGQMAFVLGKKDLAHKYFSEIKDKYDTSAEGRNIDGLIEMTRP
jgi:tetratricopeptide (TPR) repeat protein